MLVLGLEDPIHFGDQVLQVEGLRQHLGFRSGPSALQGDCGEAGDEHDADFRIHRRRFLRKLEELPFTTLVPGHGRVQRDRKYLATLEWSMRDIVAHAKAAAMSGKTKEQGFAAFGQKAEQARFGARDAWTRKWLSDYWLQGMFETAYDEAKGIPAPGK